MSRTKYLLQCADAFTAQFVLVMCICSTWFVANNSSCLLAASIDYQYARRTGIKYLGLVVVRRCDNVAMCNRIMVDQDLTDPRLMTGCVRTAKTHRLTKSAPICLKTAPMAKGIQGKRSSSKCWERSPRQLHKHLAFLPPK
ncbi:hypothetical protein BDR05DRAFT_301636 [Suillus weaverae]|nr:hypothetical protein BDR05DRAFT_301636 [Suillus weaverae]